MELSEILDDAIDQTVASYQAIISADADLQDIPQECIREWYSSSSPDAEMILIDAETINPLHPQNYRRIEITMIIAVMTSFDLANSRARHRQLTAAVISSLHTTTLYNALSPRLAEQWTLDAVQPGQITQATTDDDNYRRRNIQLKLQVTAK